MYLVVDCLISVDVSLIHLREQERKKEKGRQLGNAEVSVSRELVDGVSRGRFSYAMG